MKMMFTSGRKYKKLHSGVLRYADFKKIGNHVIGPRVPTQNLGLKLGYACFFYLIIYMTKYFNFRRFWSISDKTILY